MSGRSQSVVSSATAIPIAHAAATDRTASATSTRDGIVVPQRAALELVEGVRADSHRQRKREDGEPETSPGDAGDETAAHHDVGEVPGGVRDVEQRHVVAPAARRERVEGRP